MGVYLSKPNTAKNSSNGESAELRFGFSAMQGWRTSMEDSHLAETNVKDGVSVFGVFDGHGGAEVARFCGKYFVEHLKKNQRFVDGRYKEALEENFLKMDDLIQTSDGQQTLKSLKTGEEETGTSMAGCTAVVVLITKTEIYCANAGDSRAYVMAADGNVLPMSRDHKPEVETERQRIVKAGGYVSEGRVNDNLNLTRAIGDFEFKKNKEKKPQEQIITAFPEVNVHKIEKKPKFVIMGCDGIWESLTAKEICARVQTRLNASPAVKVSTIVEELLDKLIAKTTIDGIGCDNMTCIVIQFK